MRRALLALMAATAASAITAAGAGAAAAAVPAHPKWESSARFGAWNNGGYIIYNNEWNSSAGPQLIWADSYHHWGVQSKQRAGNTAVETYPSVQKNFKQVRVSSFRQISNVFTESMPSVTKGLDAEAADDVWLNSYKTEVMIWVDNHGQRPAGNVIGHATIFGQRFTVWHGGTDFTFALGHKESRGGTHILDSIRWLISHHYVKASAVLTQVDFGWEICSTGGTSKDFVLTRYQLTTRRA